MMIKSDCWTTPEATPDGGGGGLMTELSLAEASADDEDIVSIDNNNIHLFIWTFRQ